ncbi:MAG: type II toxin-antitoxin system VapC family toxin [Phycisphaerae bacterium]
MNLLLDTCSLLWASTAPERLSPEATKASNEANAALYVSAASMWEICLKHRLGKLDLPRHPKDFIAWAMAELDLVALPVLVEAAALEADLPPHHRDPFDRMLVCQAKHHGLTILTPDKLISQYGVPCIW